MRNFLCLIGSAAVRRREHPSEEGGQDIRSDGQEPRRSANVGGI